MKRTVLVVDDEMLKLMTLEEHLARSGYEVLTATDGATAAALLADRSVDALVTDVRMPGLDGLALLERSKALDPARPVLVMTGYATVDDAVRAMRAGAIDYMMKPVSGEEVLLRLERALAVTEMSQENRRLRRELKRLGGTSEVVLASAAMRTVFEQLRRAAETDATVLLVGETGTGKEVCARFLHEQSLRRAAPFVPVACAALAPGVVESELFGHERGAFTGAAARREGRLHASRGGTLFLDDVDDVPLDVQAKLLRVLQDGHYERVGSADQLRADVRWVAATKRSLPDLARDGRFRDDLMYRLAVVQVELPPLRERPDEIAPLAEHFLARSVERMGRPPKRFSPAALKLLAALPWPGNVRELQHAVESLVVLHVGDTIEPADLPARVRTVAHGHGLFSLHLDGRDRVPLDGLLAEVEQAAMRWALAHGDGSQLEAARLLDIPRSTFQYRWARRTR